MYRFRPFHNADPPALVDIWNQQSRQRGLVQPTNLVELEQLVFAKQYFDRHGLIVATRDGQPVGFAHAGFAPSADGSDIDSTRGATCMLMVRPEDADSSLASDLLEKSEAYLRSRGSVQIYGGSSPPLSPFYLGLYGGSELPGILDTDDNRQEFFRTHGYEEVDRVRVLQCDLGNFRPPIDRNQVRLRRSVQLLPTMDPRPENWWEASMWAMLHRLRYELVPRTGGEVLGSITLWDIEPLATTWAVRAAGLIELEIAPPHRRQGMATFLIGEALRQIYSQGIHLIEVQILDSNQPALALYAKLGFTEVDQGAILRKG